MTEVTSCRLTISTLLALGCVAACGDGPSGPGLAQPGYVLSVTLPGIADTTFEGDSLYWRILSGPNPAGGPDLRDLTLELIVLNPPPRLASPLEFKVRWSQLQTELPSVQTYALGLNPPTDVVFQAISNVGVWAASQGQLTLTSVSDTSLRGGVTATLVPVYPAGSSLPGATVHVIFWAPHALDVSAEMQAEGTIDAESKGLTKTHRRHAHPRRRCPGHGSAVPDAVQL
jgi:hypothetical protein